MARGPQLQMEIERTVEFFRFLKKLTCGIKVNDFSFNNRLLEKNPVRIFMTIYQKFYTDYVETVLTGFRFFVLSVK
jgi:hypothetical protein